MSLRARLVLALVLLAGAGLLVFGAATYAALRSFEVDRVDQQATSAVGQAVRQFERSGDHGGAGPPPGGFSHDNDDHRPPTGGIDLAPSGTYAQQRDASGAVVDEGVLGLPTGETKPAAPEIPKTLHAGERTTVGAIGSSNLRYRLYAAPTPGASSGMTVVAVPFTEIEGTLHRLLAVELIVIVVVLAALAAAGWWLVRLGLRPLDRIGATAGAIAAGDLSHRIERAESRTEVGRLGLALNAMLTRLEQAFAERRASEERLRRFLADASHELRTPLASIRGYAELFRIGAAREDVTAGPRKDDDQRPPEHEDRGHFPELAPDQLL